jgi:hypothetical protein
MRLSRWLRPKTFGLTCKILNSKSRDFSQADRFFIRASSLVFWSNSVLFFSEFFFSLSSLRKKRFYDKSGAKSATLPTKALLPTFMPRRYRAGDVALSIVYYYILQCNAQLVIAPSHYWRRSTHLRLTQMRQIESFAHLLLSCEIGESDISMVFFQLNRWWAKNDQIFDTLLYIIT